MDVQELYDYALKHGITGCPVHVHVCDNDKHVDFIAEHLDIVDFQADTEDIDGCLRIWVHRNPAEHNWSRGAYKKDELGEWLCNRVLYHRGMVKCSKCSMEYYQNDLLRIGGEFGIVNHCPNCGVPMANVYLEKSEDDIGDE